jgi:hypothetical protein
MLRSLCWRVCLHVCEVPLLLFFPFLSIFVLLFPLSFVAFQQQEKGSTSSQRTLRFGGRYSMCVQGHAGLVHRRACLAAVL